MPHGPPFIFIFVLTKQSNIPQGDGRPFHMARRSALYKLKPPIKQRSAQPRLNIERTLRIPHPFQPLPDDSWRRERDKMTGTDISAVPIGAVVHEIGLIQYSDLMSSFLQIISTA